MKITREINGQAVEFELIPEEMMSIYYEQQAVNDKADMEEFIEEEWGNNQDGFKDRYGVNYGKAIESLSELGKRLRVHIDGYGASWEDARYDALDSWSGK